MWLFSILFLLNAWADNQSFILEYRLSVGGLVINLIDGMVLVAFIAAILPFGGKNRFQVDRTHPLFGWILVCLVIGGLGAAGVAIGSGATSRSLILAIRNYVMLPVCFMIGHQALQRPRQFAWVIFILAIGSFGSGLVAMHATGTVSEKLAWGGSFNETRNTSVPGDFGIMGAAMAGFAFVSRVRLGYWWSRLIMLAGCAGALTLVPHRGFWVVALITVGGAVLWLPKVNIRRRLSMAMLGLLVLVGAASSTAVIYSSISHRNYSDFLITRLKSLLPDDRDDAKAKAWDSRIPGALREMQLWAGEPLFGAGFGYHDRDGPTHPNLAYYHNTWTSFLAQAGLVGFAGVFMMVGGMVLVGKRLISQGLDRATILIGAVGASAGIYYLILGLVTMSFNTQRHATTLALLCGLVIRARSMQLAQARMWAGYVEPGEQLPDEDLLGTDYGEARRPHAFA